MVVCGHCRSKKQVSWIFLSFFNQHHLHVVKRYIHITFTLYVVLHWEIFWIQDMCQRLEMYFPALIYTFRVRCIYFLSCTPRDLFINPCISPL